MASEPSGRGEGERDRRKGGEERRGEGRLAKRGEVRRESEEMEVGSGRNEKSRKIRIERAEGRGAPVLRSGRSAVRGGRH